jgi:hypothetical protein
VTAPNTSHSLSVSARYAAGVGVWVRNWYSVWLATFDRDTDHYIDGLSRETPRPFHVEGCRGDDEVRLHSFRDDEHRLVPEIRSSLTFAGGDGNDVLDLAGIDYALRADLARRTATWHRAHATWTSLAVFHAGAKGDTVRGTARADRIYGERGGGPGADRAYGGPAGTRAARPVGSAADRAPLAGATWTMTSPNRTIASNCMTREGACHAL